MVYKNTNQSKYLSINITNKITIIIMRPHFGANGLKLDQNQSEGMISDIVKKSETIVKKLKINGNISLDLNARKCGKNRVLL